MLKNNLMEIDLNGSLANLVLSLAQLSPSLFLHILTIQIKFMESSYSLTVFYLDLFRLEGRGDTCESMEPKAREFEELALNPEDVGPDNYFINKKDLESLVIVIVQTCQYSRQAGAEAELGQAQFQLS